FSSRRRHTSSTRDWSSDVCSSDLLRDEGHDEVGFTIVASGPNGASPHHETGARVVVEGDTVVLDFGGARGGYRSDITRTVHVGEIGRASCRERVEILGSARSVSRA